MKNKHHRKRCEKGDENGKETPEPLRKMIPINIADSVGAAGARRDIPHWATLWHVSQNFSPLKQSNSRYRQICTEYVYFGDLSAIYRKFENKDNKKKYQITKFSLSATQLVPTMSIISAHFVLRSFTCPDFAFDHILHHVQELL